MAAPFTTFPIPTTFAVSEWGLAVNVKDFGAVGNNVADDTAAIQAAIDYAYANNRTVVYMPAGTYKTTAPLWLDPPTNMRVGYTGPYTIGAVPPGNFATPPDWHFTLTLTGEPGGAALEGDGTILAPQLVNEAAIYVGPGEDMRVVHLTIYGRYVGLTRGQQNPNCIAIAYCSNGANSRTETTHVFVYHFHTGFKTAANGNPGLGDSNTFYKCGTANVYTALTIGATQNFMNTVYDCQFGDCTVCIDTRNGAGAHVFGGNMSGNGGAAAVFTIAMDAGSFAFSPPVANFYHYDFTGVITAPDAFINTVYNGYCIKTAHFGIIPLVSFGFNTGTNRINLRIDDSWSEFYFFGVNAKTSTDLQAEIEACTSLYAAERKITFIGSGISCTGGVHVENAYAPTTILQSFETFGSLTNTWLTGLVFNVDPSGGDKAGDPPGSAGQSIWYNSQVWPFIHLQAGVQVTLSNCMLQMSNNPVIIQNDSQTARLVCKENSRFGPIISRVSRQGGIDGSYVNESGTGGGEYDDTPFFAIGSNNNAVPGERWRKAGYAGNHPAWGWRPAQYSKPSIMTASLTQLAGTLPAISVSAGPTINVSYPLMWGGQVYSINDGTYTADVFDVVSNHHYYTYGQNLTTANVTGLAWSYKGQSPFIYADANTLAFMFPGLGVKLFDGATENLYLVTGVHPGLGYFTIYGGAIGNKTTVFTSTTNQIGQEPFAIKVVNGPRTVVTKTGDFTVAPLENNIIVNKGSTCTVTLPSAATYNGRAITIKTIQAFTVISATNNVVPLIGGGASNAILAATAGKWALLTSNGTNWEIVQSN